MKIEEFRNKKVAILGFGLEGQSTLRFLQKQWIDDITVLDKNEVSVMNFWKFITETSLLSYENREFECRLWDHYLDTLWDFDVIIKSPGVSPFWEKLLPYREKFISQTQIFFENYVGKIIWITGTKGKSTISTLLFSCLEWVGYRTKLVGNIWAPVLDEVNVWSWDTYDYVLYEMSSYMLQDFTPRLHIWYLNNIYPCHLDWHYDSMNIYKEAKLNILRNAEYKIINSELKDDTEVLWIWGKKVWFNEAGKYQYSNSEIQRDRKKILDLSTIQLQWEHNYRNICGVLSILDVIMWGDDFIIEGVEGVLSTFTWLPHRIENIGTYEGICFINDAIATTPESTLAAIDTFKEDLQTLFLGGENSGFDFSKLRRRLIESPVQNIIAFPDTSETIFPEIELRDYESPFELEIDGKIFQIIKTRSMKSWVDFAYKTTLPGKVALLSCAAPSFSLWKSYKQKAEEFIKEVQEY